MTKFIKNKPKKQVGLYIDREIYEAFTEICHKKGFIYTRKIELILEAWVKEQKQKGG